jgi:hypothetical protein
VAAGLLIKAVRLNHEGRAGPRPTHIAAQIDQCIAFGESFGQSYAAKPRTTAPPPAVDSAFPWVRLFPHCKVTPTSDFTWNYQQSILRLSITFSWVRVFHDIFY